MENDSKIKPDIMMNQQTDICPDTQQASVFDPEPGRLSITVIGLGLIGGSIARALHDKLGICNITAIDSDMQSLQLAQAEGIIKTAQIISGQGPFSYPESVYASDIIFVCTPVRQAFGHIRALAPLVSEKCIITDTCSTKEEISGFAEALPEKPRFIGGHPMAGTEKSGYANSFSHLFENAYYVLTPGSNVPKKSLDTLIAVIQGIGAIPLVMSPAEHDRATGGISHLPHVIAAALVNLVKELDSGEGKMKALAAGGFRDITRIASSNPLMWENIVLSNKAQISELVARFKSALDDFTSNLENENSDAIYNFFHGAGQFRDTISTQTAGIIPPACRLIVDVEDKPGIIGEIATILGKNNINIKNINVSNSREFEQGCLIISLPDNSSVNIAFDLLINTGYKVFKTK